MDKRVQNISTTCWRLRNMSAKSKESHLGRKAHLRALHLVMTSFTKSEGQTTQRILLRLESATIGRRDAHDRVVKNVLRRYVEEDYGLMRLSGPFYIPRFLQNDIARYWRTVAVDFAYKQRQREDKGWALRVTKLRMSRKLTYVSGLLTCFSCHFELFKGSKDTFDESSRALAIVEYLFNYSQKTPLEILAHVLNRFPHLD